MRYFFLFLQYVMITVIIVSCSSPGPAGQKSEVRFYKRDIGGGSENGKMSDPVYFDYLMITEYVDGSKTVHDFYKIARAYLDTVKSDNQIGTIAFLGQKPCCKLPSSSYNNPIRGYELLSFGFVYKTQNKKAFLSNIALSKNGENHMLWYQIPNDSLLIDSLLSSDNPYKNGYNSTPSYPEILRR